MSMWDMDNVENDDATQYTKKIVAGEIDVYKRQVLWNKSLHGDMTPKNEQWKHGIGGLAMISDSGNRTEFETGAVRDIQEGKGRCDLLPLDIVNAITRRKILELLAEFQRTLEKERCV